jgi:acetoin utilization deacetylase AcuC-like enzyme
MKPLMIFTHPDFAKHDTGYGHPECAGRITAVQDMMDDDFADCIERAYPAPDERLLLAHPQSYIDMVLDNIPFDGYAALDGDTVLNPHSFDVALLGVGAACQAVDAVLSNDTQTAFVAARPPGHHAEYDKAMGFCLFANAFIAARHGNVRTLIIDFDVHHGNGTEDLVKRRVADGHTDIAYASTHQAPFWPFTGDSNSQNICNCPLPAQSGSPEFRAAITDTIIPFAHKFAPDLILFSAGFDAHADDLLAELNFNDDDFAWVVNAMRPICRKMVSVLEGGYNLDTLPRLVKTHLKALSKAA